MRPGDGGGELNDFKMYELTAPLGLQGSRYKVFLYVGDNTLFKMIDIVDLDTGAIVGHEEDTVFSRTRSAPMCGRSGSWAFTLAGNSIPPD
jgi:hypothetical protein